MGPWEGEREGETACLVNMQSATPPLNRPLTATGLGLCAHGAFMTRYSTPRHTQKSTFPLTQAPPPHQSKPSPPDSALP